jgi:hypothetical protein
MGYTFQGISYSTGETALRAIASAWIYGGMRRPFPETLAEEPASLAAECIEGWGLEELLAQWGETHETFTEAMAGVLRAACIQAAGYDAEY